MQRSGGPDSHSGAGHGGSADRNLPSPHANAWLFSAQDPAPLSSASSSKTATDSASSHLLSASPMIGPGPSYYDPESASAQQHAQAQNYQQWIDNYGRQREDIHHLQQQQQHRHHHQQRQQQQQPSPRELAYQQHTYGVPGYGVDAPPGGTGSLAHYPSAAYGQQPLPSHQQHPRQQQAPPNDMFTYFPSDVAQTYPGQFSPQDYPPMSASASVSASVVPSPTQWADADAFRGPPVGRSVSASHATGASSAPPAPTQANKRKRARKTPERAGNSADSDSDSDDDGGGRPAFTGGISVGMGGLGVKGQKQNSSRLPGACTHCKKLKMKCEFKKNENTCKRCQSGGHVCIVEGRKPRTAPK